FALLRARTMRVFYDRDRREGACDLWGLELESKLREIYAGAEQHCVAFVSQDYFTKEWCRFEFETARAEDVRRPGYLLIVTLDGPGSVPSELRRRAFIDAASVSPEACAERILAKAGHSRREQFIAIGLFAVIVGFLWFYNFSHIGLGSFAAA